MSAQQLTQEEHVSANAGLVSGFRHRLIVDGGLVAVMVLMTIAIPWAYVSSERYFYHSDLAMFHDMTRTKAATFQNAPLHLSNPYFHCQQL
jgi:hypothetical protein